MFTTIIIVDDRYSGAYSGAQFTAWRNVVPDEIDAADPDCEKFWNEFTGICGKGQDQMEALADLLSKIRRREKPLSVSNVMSYELDKLPYLTVRAHRILTCAGFRIVADIVHSTESQLLELPTFTRKNLFEVRESLSSLGLSIGGDK